MSDSDAVPIDEQLRLLVALADAFAVPLEETGTRQAIDAFYVQGSKHLQHHALPEGHLARVDEEMLRSLAYDGLISIEYGNGSDQIFVTADGDRVAAQARRVLAGDGESAGPALDLDWEEVARPVLEATYRVWSARGVPADGVLTTSVIAELGGGEEVAHRTRRVVEALTEAGYLAAAGPLRIGDAPAAVVVAARGLEVVGRWPATTADAATHALLVALDRAIEETTEPERKTKLERLRETALDVGQSTLADLLARVITSGA